MVIFGTLIDWRLFPSIRGNQKVIVRIFVYKTLEKILGIKVLQNHSLIYFSQVE